MHFINGYAFDSNRLLIYNKNISPATIDMINASYDSVHLTRKPEDMQLDPDNMNMNKIAIDRAGICFTYNCNLRCRYCGYSSDECNSHRLQLDDIKLFMRDLLTKRTIKKLLTKENKPLTIDFTGGGEPTYDWELFEKSIQHIKNTCEENRIPVSLHLTTNGMLSDYQREFISNNFNHVMISYDGIPEAQNKNRISPYEKDTSSIVENTIRQLSKNRIPLTIRSTVWQADFERLPEMYHHVFSLVQTEAPVIWSIYPVLFEGRAVTRIKKQEETTYSQFLLEYIKLTKYIISTEGEERLKSIDVPLFNNNICDIFCGAHRTNQPWLLPDRSIVTCIESKDDKATIGKISDGKVQYFENYQDRLLKITQQKYVECQDCIAYHTCKGGCPIWHLRVDGDIQEPLECCLQKEYWKYVLNSLVVGEYSLGWKLEKLALPEAQNEDVYKLVKEM